MQIFYLKLDIRQYCILQGLSKLHCGYSTGSSIVYMQHPGSRQNHHRFLKFCLKQPVLYQCPLVQLRNQVIINLFVEFKACFVRIQHIVFIY